MMGRQFGTEGNLKGTQYIANELARLGIQPGGAGGSYFQDVPAFRVSLAPGAQVVLDGAPLAFGTDYITNFPASGRAIPVDSVQVVFGGDLSDTTTLIAPDRLQERRFCSRFARRSSAIRIRSWRGTRARGRSSPPTIRGSCGRTR